MKPTIADVLSAIPKFTQAELRQIYARVGVLLAKMEQPTEDRQDEKSVYIAWSSLLNARYGTRLPAYEIARTLSWYKRYKITTGARAVIEFIDHEVPGLRGADREGAIMQCVASCVGTLRSNAGQEATIFAAAALRDVAACVDRSFPGYVEYGMLRIVFCSQRVTDSESRRS